MPIMLDLKGVKQYNIFIKFRKDEHCEQSKIFVG